MQQEVIEAMVAWVGVILVSDVLFAELPIQRCGSLLESVVVALAAVEMDRKAM